MIGYEILLITLQAGMAKKTHIKEPLISLSHLSPKGSHKTKKWEDLPQTTRKIWLPQTSTPHIYIGAQQMTWTPLHDVHNPNTPEG